MFAVWSIPKRIGSKEMPRLLEISQGIGQEVGFYLGEEELPTQPNRSCLHCQPSGAKGQEKLDQWARFAQFDYDFGPLG